MPSAIGCRRARKRLRCGKGKPSPGACLDQADRRTPIGDYEIARPPPKLVFRGQSSGGDPAFMGISSELGELR